MDLIIPRRSSYCPNFATAPVAEPALAEQEEEIVTEQQQLETGESDRT
ncbi:hypothetical protein [Corynebacterium glutamicum]|nr:hypothetical protein [Corynebacterium glutamicum]